MGLRRLVRFSKHALNLRMPQRNIAVDDVLVTLANPTYEFPGNRPGTLESYGTTADGRTFYVVAAQDRTFVITVALVEDISMFAPVEIHADLEANAYEITYRHLSEGERVDRDERIAPSGSAGIDARGNVIAIELLDLEPATIAAAREYAQAHGLAFPRDLAGVLAAA
jgi:hypothetical protein